MDDYRDELAAAHSRIAELEDLLGAGGDSVREPLGELQAERAAIEMRKLSGNRWIVVMFAIYVAVIVIGIPVMLTWPALRGVQLDGASLCAFIFAPMVLATVGDRLAQRSQKRRQLAAVDRRIVELLSPWFPKTLARGSGDAFERGRSARLQRGGE